jgi:hypothetical protein
MIDRSQDSDKWNEWSSLEGELTSDPHPICCDGKVYVFVRGTDKGLWYRVQNGDKWNEWSYLKKDRSNDIKR